MPTTLIWKVCVWRRCCGHFMNTCTISHYDIGACEGSLACSTCHVVVEVDGCARHVFVGLLSTCPPTTTTTTTTQDQKYYDKIPEADDDENDMLDLAFGLTDTYGVCSFCMIIHTHPCCVPHTTHTVPSYTTTIPMFHAHRSRLGCQIKTTEDLDGLVVRIPAATRNFAVDGHIPKPH